MPDLKGRPFYLTEEQETWVYETLKKLSTEEKAGQLFCAMGGDYGEDELEELVKNSRIGGVLFRPVETGEQIRERYRKLDQIAPVPLLKAANLEEGGSGGMSDGTLFGWPMTAAATGEDNVVEKFAKVCAVEGNQVGINWTFSPICDIDINYRNPITNVRTNGSDKERVKKNTQIYVETLQKAGMAACAKHFPGDGVDYRDQHLHPTYNTLSAEEWYGSYGAIYENLIEHDLLSIMVGHIVQPAVSMDVNSELTLEDCLPASLSRELLTGILRKRYSFNGVITTDATIMGGYCEAMERQKAIPASIMAGCDMLVFSTDLKEDYGYILKGLKSGLLTEERLDEAVTRILALKAKICGMEKSVEDIPAEEWAKECADKAVTLVKNKKPEVLPVTREKYDSIRLIMLGKDDILDGSVKEIGKRILEEKGFQVEVYDPFSDDLHGTAGLSGKRLTLYLANYEQASNQTVVRINWCPKHALDSPRFVNEEDCIFVSLANPYLLQDVPRIKTYINAYTATENTIRAVIEKLLGESEFKGISPVDPFCGLVDTRL
jgi:beta-N-acetylhexosaminidase